MPTKYVVKPGDTLASIAKQHKLPSTQAIYNAPENAGFRRKRPNPNIIFPGDELMLPDPARVAAPVLDILAAIDGTGSSDWIQRDKDGEILGGNSSVFRFYRDFQTGEPLGGTELKDYFDGPNTLGTNVGKITKAVTEFVTEALSEAPAARVSMVGHSRGGLIAILASADLKIPIHFLGLYDAVDRHVGAFARTIPGNVGTVYHAMRDPITHSRMGFGNCGLKFAEGVKYFPKKFKATHGGIGGDSIGAHETEAKHTKILTAGAYLLGGPVAAIATYTAIDVSVDVETDQLEGKKADEFIRDGARSVKLRI